MQTPIQKVESQAWGDAYRAKKNSNPYAKNSAKWLAYERGYKQGQKDYKITT